MNLDVIIEETFSEQMDTICVSDVTDENIERVLKDVVREQTLFLVYRQL